MMALGLVREVKGTRECRYWLTPAAEDLLKTVEPTQLQAAEPGLAPA